METSVSDNQNPTPGGREPLGVAAPPTSFGDLCTPSIAAANATTTNPVIKRDCVVLLSRLPRKLEEWQGSLRPYGLRVEMLPCPSSNDEIAEIASRPDVRFVCDEESRLWAIGGGECSWYHLEQVIHKSMIHVYTVRDGKLVTEVYESSKSGYLDLTNGGRTADGWWDTAFRLSSTHETYQKMRPKRSARDEALSHIMSHKLHYRRAPPSPAEHRPLRRPVDFSESVAKELREQTFYFSDIAREMYVSGLVEMAINRGLFERRGINRPQSHFWESNFGGLPKVSKPDPIHTATYRFHDVTHMLLGEAVLVDEKDQLSRQIYYLSRMCSEAFTLFLADGLFVESLRRSGSNYDFSKRKAHPFLVGSLGLLDRTPTREELLSAVKANARFFVLGDTVSFRDLIGAGTEHERAFDDYTKWYRTFSGVDAEWTLRNYNELTQQGVERRKWWEGVAAIRDANPYLNVYSVTELSSRLDWGSRAASDGTELGMLLDLIVEEAFDRNISSVVERRDEEKISTEEHTRRAFVRWMSGQLYIFDVLGRGAGSSRCQQMIIDTLIQSQAIFGPSQVADFCANTRSLLDSYLGALKQNDVINTEEHCIWGDCFPHFPAHFLSYRSFDEAAFNLSINSLIDPRSGLPSPSDVAAGAVVVMTDGKRFILQQKDDQHPIESCRGRYSLFGGSCDDRAHMHAAELSWVGLLRELREEIKNDRLVHDIYHRTRHGGQYILPGNQFPGEYQLSLYIARTDPATLDSWFKAMKEPGAVTEGVPVLMSTGDLKSLLKDTNNFVASVDDPLAKYLSRSDET